MTLTIEIPLPSRACSPNTYKHWRTRGRGAKELREWAFMAAMEKNAPMMQAPVRVSHTWYMAKRGPDDCYRPIDAGNAQASLKAAIDGLVDAKLIPGDNHKQLKWGECRLYRTAKEHKGKCGVVLTLEPLA